MLALLFAGPAEAGPTSFGNLLASKDMRPPRTLVAGSLCVAAVLVLTSSLTAAERTPPPRLASAPGNAFTESERQGVIAWVMAQPKVKAAVEGRRTRLLRAWSDVAKGEAGPYRRATLLLRDYEAGIAREVTANLTTGRIEMRELAGVPPSEEEIEEGMAIVRADPALARFVEDPGLRLMGGFHNRGAHQDDACAREICLEFAFMRPGYGKGPARYVVVNLTRRIVANHDFRGTPPGQSPARMTEDARN